MINVLVKFVLNIVQEDSNSKGVLPQSDFKCYETDIKTVVVYLNVCSITWLKHGCTNSENHVSRATILCTMAPDNYCSSIFIIYFYIIVEFVDLYLRYQGKEETTSIRLSVHT
jgi:hypothetical protein